MGIAGTNEMQAHYTPGHDKKCPSCGIAIETCSHILSCEEAGWVAVLHKSAKLLEQWMQDHGTERELRRLVVQYVHGGVGTTMQETVDISFNVIS